MILGLPICVSLEQTTGVGGGGMQPGAVVVVWLKDDTSAAAAAAGSLGWVGLGSGGGWG